MTVLGSDRPIPPPPPQPPTVGLPRDRGVAATAALLNLSGLGAGYLYLRHWRRAVAAWLLTGALLFVALPVPAEGMSGWWAVLYAAGLLVLAADAWRLARPAAPGRRALLTPVTAGVLLLALPASGTVLFNDAQERALESALQDRLTAADGLVERAGGSSFDGAEDRYRSALTEYLAVRGDHPDTDAAAEVPDRLDALYGRATEERPGEDACAALAPLRFFQDLPDDFEDPEAGRLAERAGGDLPEPLHGCGIARTGQADMTGAEEPLGELLNDHPESPYATGLAEELGGLRDTAVDGLAGDAPCESLEELRGYNTLLAALPGDDFGQLAAGGEAPVPDGLFACGSARFLSGDYTGAETSLTELVTDHPEHDRAGHAGDILIAAQIAAELPAAGEELPPAPGSGGGGATVIVEVLNDSPNELELLWTGPRTGSETVAPCPDCSIYPADPGTDSCTANIDYPSTTLELPAGDYHFLHRSPELSASNLAETTGLDADYIYTWCSYTTEQDLLWPGLEDLEDLTEETGI
ncbi:hypothetical protein [Streptomyces sp. MP131-18]|uniref:hypothetical protein n=1 Tax=Streptomyces sp. MP131-18 TaxID=1857892 RepID=UPI00097C889A|nr:hypothetical protein [Streptomyces sp. MP131-18]ONK14677.1 hypothetical protein STBA_54650 [Streptomyces sp. MP131-18]